MSEAKCEAVQISLAARNDGYRMIAKKAGLVRARLKVLAT